MHSRICDLTSSHTRITAAHNAAVWPSAFPASVLSERPRKTVGQRLEHIGERRAPAGADDTSAGMPGTSARRASSNVTVLPSARVRRTPRSLSRKSRSRNRLRSAPGEVDDIPLGEVLDRVLSGAGPDHELVASFSTLQDVVSTSPDQPVPATPTSWSSPAPPSNRSLPASPISRSRPSLPVRLLLRSSPPVRS